MEAETSEKPALTKRPSGSLTTQDLSAIEDEEVLNKMLDETDSFEERRMIRAALRDLLKKKREKREKERGTRQQDLKQQGLSKGEATGTPLTTAKGLKNQQPLQQKPANKFSPSPSSTFNKLTDGKVTPAVASAVKCPTSAQPSTKNVKQMLLDWCRAKTEPYEGVEIKNFSSSWRDGIAFCALVHRFFPDAFEYSILDPNNYRENFQLAFSTAEKLANCPPLLDVDDLLRMDEPDWKCVYTYIQEFYRCLVEKGLVKTKKRP